MNKVHGLEVINPGPFNRGNFVIIELEKSEILSLW